MRWGTPQRRNGLRRTSTHQVKRAKAYAPAIHCDVLNDSVVVQAPELGVSLINGMYEDMQTAVSVCLGH